MIRMLLDNILVLPEVEEEISQTASGIFMVKKQDDFAVPDKCVGTVIAVGKGAYSFGQWVEPTVKEGDKIQYRPSTGFKLEYDDIEYVCLKEADIMAVLED